MDTLSSGRRSRVLTLVDDFTRECLGLVFDTSLTALRVVRELGQIIESRGYPRIDHQRQRHRVHFQCYIGLAGGARDRMAHIAPGKPMQNGFVESFNGRLRGECLNEHLFANLNEARQIIGEWRIDYTSTGSRQPSLQPGLTGANPEQILLWEQVTINSLLRAH